MWVSGDSAFEIHAGDAPAGILDGEILRAAVHGVVRAANRDFGQLAGPAEPEAHADVAAGGFGADWEINQDRTNKRSSGSKQKAHHGCAFYLFGVYIFCTKGSRRVDE